MTALRAVDAVWIRTDGDLRVVEASAAALDFFRRPRLPDSLINVVPSAEFEARAGQVALGEGGPWEVDLAHFDRTVRVRGTSLGGDGIFMYLEDLTELRHLEAVRADFVANLAHELRTPVASLSLAVETLGTDLNPEDRATFVRRVTEEAEYIEGLLRAVTDMALLERDIRLTLGPVELAGLVTETWRRVTDRQGAGVLENSIDPQTVVLADRVRLAEVLQNLLENAHRYSPLGAMVTVTADVAVELVTITVQDRGPGIAPADMTRIFERFYKVDRARTRLGDGSGLGLAIARHLVVAHGGRIWAEPGAGGGTAVRFTLAQPSSVPLTGI